MSRKSSDACGFEAAKLTILLKKCFAHHFRQWPVTYIASTTKRYVAFFTYIFIVHPQTIRKA